MATSLLDMIFTEILKVSPSLLSKYTTIQDQMIYLVLIPSAILFLFLHTFSIATIGRVIGHHKGFEFLFSIVAFIYIVYSGMFGRTLMPLFDAWMYAAIIVALFFFLISAVIHPVRIPSMMKFGNEIGKEIGGKLAKGKQAEAIEKEIELIDKQIRDLEKPAESKMAKAYNEMQVSNLRQRRRELEAKL